MKIEVGKFYRTRCGDLVQITTDQGETMREHNPDAVAAEFYQRGGLHPELGLQAWREDGRFYMFGECPHDIVEEVTILPGVPEPAESAGGASIYKDVNGDAHAVRSDADVEEIDRDATRRAIIGLRRGARMHSVAIAILALIAIIFSRQANATDLAWMPNDAGGEIVLTDIRTQECGEARVVVARAAGGRAIVGCYAYTETGYVAARFGTDLRVWKLEDFRLFDAPVARGTRL
jgi:hypothetical protein